MPRRHPGPEPPLRRLSWSRATRIVASRYPPIDLFERVSADPAVWDALIVAAALVDPRLRDEVGEIRLVPPEERVSGPGATYVMAAFTHPSLKGSRFSDGSYGVYYAGQQFRTALRETAHHFARFASDSGDGPRYEDTSRAERSRPRSGMREAMAWSTPAYATPAGSASRSFVQAWSGCRRRPGI
jgi:hypothetical protein